MTSSAESDWDHKASVTFHTKKSKNPPKLLQKASFLTFCMSDCKSPKSHCDQSLIATVANPPLKFRKKYTLLTSLNGNANRFWDKFIGEDISSPSRIQFFQCSISKGHDVKRPES
jgi:hypothetical protein